MKEFSWNKQQKTEVVKSALTSCGYVFEHPTLVLEGLDGWFVILTPGRSPHQAIVHIDDQNKVDFLTTVPELLE